MNEDAILAVYYRYRSLVYWVLSRDDVPDNVKSEIRRQLAAEAGVTPSYLSMVLNGHRSPADAEEKLTAALDRLISDKSQSVT